MRFDEARAFEHPSIHNQDEMRDEHSICVREGWATGHRTQHRVQAFGVMFMFIFMVMDIVMGSRRRAASTSTFT